MSFDNIQRFHFIAVQKKSHRRTQDDFPLYEKYKCASGNGNEYSKNTDEDSQSFPVETPVPKKRDCIVEALEKDVQTESHDNISKSSNTVAIDYKESGSVYCTKITSIIPSREDLIKQKVEVFVEAIMKQENTLLDSSEGQVVDQSDNLIGGLIDSYDTFDRIQLERMTQKFFQSKSVLKQLCTLERALQQNMHRRQQIFYRNLPLAPIPTENESSKALKSPSLKHLFYFLCPATSKKIITSMAFHHVSKDVLAVGYAGDRETFDQGGLVMLWSLRNPSFPEMKIETKSAVTALAFSSLSPTVLAVGFEDGCLSLYDTSHDDCSANFISTGTTIGRHMTTVTQLHWVIDKQQNKIEKLLSSSTDGRVLQWSMKQGMCLQPLVTLKRHGKNKDNVLQNYAMSLCMDLPKVGDSMMYVTGCEDGSLFVCSRSYTDKLLEETKAHISTVTSVSFSPFEESLFLSSSADSTIKLWRYHSKQNSLEAVLTIHPEIWAPVNDVAWSPRESSVFALVTGDRRIQIWDFEKTTLDPIINILVDGKELELTKIMFGENGDVIFTADEEGTVSVYRIHGA